MSASSVGVNAREAGPRAEESPSLFKRLERIYPVLNQAAGDFLLLLSDTDFKGDLTLTAKMAGLKLLRNSGADLSRHTPGNILLGAIPDEAYEQMQRFMYSWYLSNGIPVASLRDIKLPKEDMAYIPRVSRLEPEFDSICQRYGLQPEDTPYAAAVAAIKLVAAGMRLQLMDLGVSQYMTYFPILSASKMVPEPPSGA